MNKRNRILIAIVAILILCSGVFLCKNILDKKNINNSAIANQINTKDNEIVLEDNILSEVEDTKEATESGEDLSTKEVIESSSEEETTVVDEGAIESDAQVEQENIAYEGTNTGNGLSLLGAYQGLTYYSQADSRWANIMYSSIGDSSQTMKSSACGPTSMAMVVSSSKGAILPTTMASLAVSNGYRTASAGTAWSFFPFCADYFDFKEYYSTGSFDTAINYLKTDADNNGVSDYYVIVSCGAGLFTTGGHYICLVGDENGTINVYDPYLYSGKFSTASRRNAGVVVSGNSAYVSESAFKTYSNYKNFWVFSNDNGGSYTPSAPTTAITKHVATQSANLNVRSTPGGTVIGSLAKGTQVTVYETNNGWSRIAQGWVSSSYLSSTPVTTQADSTSSSIKYVKVSTSLNVRAGAGTNYKVVGSKSNGDKVTVYATKNGWSRIGTNQWVSSQYLVSSSTSSSASTVGQIKTLKTAAVIYSKSSLSGTQYNYKKNTRVRVLQNVSNSVDKIQVIATGRIGYINKNLYK